jgi:hypothetical protein
MRGLVIEVAGRFVSQQHEGVIDQRARDGNALLLTAREFVRERRGFRRESHLHQQSGYLGADGRARGTRDFQRERHILLSGAIGKQAKILKHDAEAAAQLRNLALFDGRRRKTADAHFALGGALGHRDQLEQRALARAAVPGEKEKLPLFNSKDTLRMAMPERA